MRGALYSDTGRPSIPPERLLKAQLLIALYSVRSDRQFCEMLDYNILFRWFLDMSLEEAGLAQSNFSRLRERLVHTRHFIQRQRDRGIAPHIAQIDGRSTPGLDARTTRHPGYQISQRKRKRIEEIFGWLNTYGGLRKTRFIGTVRVQLHAYFAGAAYNLLRMSRLQISTA